MFDTHPDRPDVEYAGMVDELRRHTTDWLTDQRAEAIREQRLWRLRELAITRVLDDRGAIDDSTAARDGVSIRTVRENVATARALEELPQIAEVAASGALSNEQLSAVARLADAESDAHWAAEAPTHSPDDLAHLARTKAKPTAADGAARRSARELAFWWRRDGGMLSGRFELPDLDGALFESVINHMVDRMRPAKGRPWETRARRGADALVELCRSYAGEAPVSGPVPLLVVQVPPEGPATIAGIPLPDEMVESLRAEAKIEPVAVDRSGSPLVAGRSRTVLSPKTVRAVKLRDGKCRWPGCDRRTGLQIHHLWPVSWGGDDAKLNLASVCVGGGSDHHAQLAPQGPYLLLGNPNQPNGLRLVHRDELRGLAQPETVDARAGPQAA